MIERGKKDIIETEPKETEPQTVQIVEEIFDEHMNRTNPLNNHEYRNDKDSESEYLSEETYEETEDIDNTVSKSMI